VYGAFESEEDFTKGGQKYCTMMLLNMKVYPKLMPTLVILILWKT